MKTITSIIISLFMAAPTLSFQPVDINSASLEQLMLLPGVGKKLAEDILIYRKRHGPLSGPAHLSQVNGMTDKKLEHMRDHMVFLGPVRQVKKTLGSPPLPEPKKIILLNKPIISLYALETSVLNAQGLSQDLDQSLSSRSRIAAWLPKLSALFDVDRGDVTTEKKVENSSDSLLRRGGRDFSVGVRATFDLEKLIFNRDELEVAKLSLKRLEKRDEVISKVQKNYFRYLRLAKTAESPVDVTTAQAISLEMAEIEAVLDSMSMGEFTRFQVAKPSAVAGRA